MLSNASRGYLIALTQIGFGLLAIGAVACGGGGSNTVDTSAPKVAAPTAAQPTQPVGTGVAGAATTAPTATQPAATRVTAAATPGPTTTQPAQPAAAKVAGAPPTGDPKARLEALMTQEFAGFAELVGDRTGNQVPRLQVMLVREDTGGGYRVQVEFYSDDVPFGSEDREKNLARKLLMEERMQHAFLTLYTSGIDIENAFMSAKFKMTVQGIDAFRTEVRPVVFKTWMTREKAAAVNWQDPSLDLRSVWEVVTLNPSYR